MAVVGNLVAKMSLSHLAFDKGVRSVTGSSTRMGKALGKTTGFVKSYGVALLAAATGGGLIAMIKGQMSAIDKIAKLSDQLDIGTESLVGLMHAAELTGAGADSVGAAFSTLGKRLGESMRSGTGPAAMALTDLGLDIQEIGRMGLDKAFYKITDAMGKVEGASRKNAIAANLFSKKNMALLVTMQAGTAGLRAMQKEAEALGLTFSRIEASRIEAANDAMTKLKGTMTGIGRSLTIELAPLLEGIAELGTATESGGKKAAWYVSLLREWQGLGVDTLGLIAKTGVPSMITTGNLSDMADQLRYIESMKKGLISRAGETDMPAVGISREAFKRLEMLAEQGDRAAAALLTRMGDAAVAKLDASDIAAQATAMSGLADAMEKMQVATDQVGMGKIALAVDKLVRPLYEAGIEAEALEQAALQAENAVLKLFDAQDKVSGLKKAAGIFEQMRTPFEKFEKQSMDLLKLFSVGAFDAAGGIETYTRAMLEAVDAFAAAGGTNPFRAMESMLNQGVISLQMYETLVKRMGSRGTGMGAAEVQAPVLARGGSEEMYDLMRLNRDQPKIDNIQGQQLARLDEIAAAIKQVAFNTEETVEHIEDLERNLTVENFDP